MTRIIKRIIRASAARLAIKAAKSAPVIGAAVAIGLIGYEVKKKGLIKGLVSTALDATPVLGVTKNAIEMFTGDWLSDKPTSQNERLSEESKEQRRAT